MRHAESETAQPRDHAIAAPRVGVAHSSHGRLAVRERRDPRALHEAVRRDEQVLRQDLERPYALARRYEPAEPKARHRIALREAVEHVRIVAHLERGRHARAAVDEPVVDLVGDERYSERRDRAQRLGALHRAGRVRWRADHDRARARSNRAPHGVGVERVAALWIRRHEHRHAAAHAYEARVAGIVRRADHHLVPGIDEQREHEQHRRRGAAGHEDPLGVDVHREAPREVGRDRAAQLEQAAAVGVARLPVAQRGDARLHHLGRRREVGLADLEMQDLPARALDREGALHHLHGEERFDLGDPRGGRARHASG